MIKLTLPFPLTVNHMWGQSGHRKYLKQSAHEFRSQVSEAVAEQGIKLEGRLAIFVSLYAPTRREYDIDNRLKSLLDALQNAGVFDDDEQIDWLWVGRREVVRGGMCKVVIVQADADLIGLYHEINKEVI